MYDYFIQVLFFILYNMSYYTIIRSKQDHLIKTNTRQISIKVKPNTEIAGKEIYQPRATIAYSESNQVDNELQKNVQFSNKSEEISHIISPSTRRIKGFKVECLNGQIINKQPNKTPATPYIGNKDKQKLQIRALPETHNFFQPIDKQRQSDEFMFNLQPFHNSKQGILPEITPNNIALSQNNAIYKEQQKEKTIIESIISREQIIERGHQIQIQKVHQQFIVKKEEKLLASKQIKRYQIEENYVEYHSNGSNLKSPQKNKQRHPIFINENAEFFEESAANPQSVHPQVQTFKIEQKYTPIQHIQSPKLHFTPHQPAYYGVDSTYKDESIYLNKQPQL